MNRPLAGATVRVDGTDVAVVTDAKGNFRLDNAPAGRFFVHIDGTTVAAAEGYYPSVGKAWESQGEWEIVGSMTVSSDGRLVVSDPGQGILAPGWHGTWQGELLAWFGFLGGPRNFDPCQIATYTRLLDERQPRAVRDAVATSAGSIQTIGDGQLCFYEGFIGCLISVHEYKVTVQLPAGVSPNDLLKDMLADLNGFFDAPNFLRDDEFDAINEFAWEMGADPRNPMLGDTVFIDILGPDNAAVVASDLNLDDQQNGYWVFTTIEHATTGTHPVYSNREFGFERNDDGSVTFYTRGLDSPHDPIGGTFGALIQKRGWGSFISSLRNRLTVDLGARVVEDVSSFVRMLPTLPPCHQPLEPGAGALSPFAGGGAGVPLTAAGRLYYRVDYSLSDDLTSLQPRTLRGVTSDNGAGSVILPGAATYALFLYDPSTDRVGLETGVTTNGGRSTGSLAILVDLPSGPDGDRDGLGQLAESVLGTDAGKADSDGDGVPDGAEVAQGTNPLDGRVVPTGVVATADPPGLAVDVCAVEDVAIVADPDAGISVFNVFSGMDPTIIAQVDTPGTALAVSCSGDLIAVGDADAGLAIVDLSDPPAAGVIHQVSAAALGGGIAQAAATAGNLAFVGTVAGTVAMVDMRSGAVLDSVLLGRRIEDLAIERDSLYVYTEGQLDVLEYNLGCLELVTSTPSPSQHGPRSRTPLCRGRPGLPRAPPRVQRVGYLRSGAAADVRGGRHASVRLEGPCPQRVRRGRRRRESKSIVRRPAQRLPLQDGGGVRARRVPQRVGDPRRGACGFDL